jgi:GDP-L-fucose synthase
MREEHLLTGPLERTNEPYAVAKIAGVKLCESFNRQYRTRYRCVMPTNLYGPHDNFDLESSHVIPALLRKFHEARVDGAADVTVWGTGTAKREFLHVDDLADACVFLMERDIDDDVINVGAGEDVSICELAELVREVVGFEGGLVFDWRRPDGTPRKLLDVSKLRSHGWRPRHSLREGLARTYAWYRQQVEQPCRASAR